MTGILLATWAIPPLWILAIGVAIVLGLIIVLRVNAFLALISAAIVVSLLAPGEPADKIRRVAAAFGSLAGSIGIVIAMASIIGKCMLDSGAADRIVRAFVRLLGQKRSPVALMVSGYVLAVPVFFDTVFYLLVPLARSLYRRTRGNYLLYLLAISVGGALTHTLVPPTPGPLMMAATLRIDIGLMMLVGAAVAIPSALVGLAASHWLDRRLDVPMRQISTEPEPEPLADHQLPSLAMALLPVLLPVVLISTNTVVTAMADAEHRARLQAGDVQWDTWMPVLRQAYRQPTADGDPSQKVAHRIVVTLEESPQLWQQVEPILAESQPPTAAEAETLRHALNEGLLPNKTFFDDQTFIGIPLPPAAEKLLGQDRLRMKPVEAERMNRLLLEAAFPNVVAPHVWESPLRRAANYGDLFGDASLALLLSAILAMIMLKYKRGLSLQQLAHTVEVALMSAGIIILITAGGGAFGAMLSAAQVGEAIKELFPTGTGAGMLFLVIGFLLATVLKVAQGSSTVAMITGAGMLAGIADPRILGFNPVYLATSIGAGSLVGSWMNDSGFWVFAKMGGVTEVESLKSWTPILALIGTVSFVVSMVMAWLLPLNFEA